MSAPETVEVPSADSVKTTRRIDLDAARRARQEARGDTPAPVVVLGGVEYPLRDELPAEALTAFGALFVGEDVDKLSPAVLGGLEDALVSIFGAETWASLKEQGLSLDDFEVLLEGAFEAYGVELGE